MKYFSYDPETGMEFFNTADEAKASAKNALSQFDGSDGWPENMEDICWGEVKQSVTMTNKRNAETGSDFDYLCDYELRDEAAHPGSQNDGEVNGEVGL